MISSTFVKTHQPRSRRCSALRFAIALLVPFGLLTTATAHPYDPGYYSLRSALRVDPVRGLQVMAVAEVPNMDMLEAFVRRFGVAEEYEQSLIDGFIAGYFDVFAAGLSVELGGEPLAGRWEAVDDPRNGRVGDQGLFLFMLRFVPDDPPALDAGPLEVVVHMESFEGEDTYFSGSVEALTPWRVTFSSARELLGEVTGTEDVNECFECWSRDESLRHSRARFMRAPAGEARAGPSPPVTQP